MHWREHDDIRWLEAELPADGDAPGARAAFTARLGGISGGPYATLNVAVKTGDDRDAVRVNRARLAAAVGRDPASIVIGRQVHGADLAWHGRRQSPSVYAEAIRTDLEADAELTAEPELTPLVMVADCLPVALVGGRGVAMVHCGWRGLAAGVIERAVSASDARAAAIGPGIGACCYEVGDEVLAAFAGIDGAAEGRRLDLTAVVRALLRRAGVTAIQSAGLCTSCERDLFFSHRRDGPVTGRQAGLAWLA